MKKKICMSLLTLALMIMGVVSVPNDAMAAEKFDPAFYAATYADVTAALGTDPNALYDHYNTYGKSEGRQPYANAPAGADVDGIASTTVVVPAAQPADTGIVPIDKLANYKSLKKNMTDAEFQAAYNEALKIVQPLVGKDKTTQLTSIMSTLRARFDAGMSYSTDAAHYNDAYGYLILGSVSCAGSARTTGLCLNMLGYPYEHVNENQWSHQWCRVAVGDGYWICDPFACYAGAEPGAYMHPYVY